MSLPANSKSIGVDHRRSAPGTVQGRLRKALIAMIWENLTDNEAAVKFKISLQAIRSGLKRPHVRLFVKQEKQVLIARESARNPHALIDVRDNSPNGNARVAAVRALEQIEVEASAQATPRIAGLQIVVVTGPTSPQVAAASPSRVVEHRPAVGFSVGTAKPADEHE